MRQPTVRLRLCRVPCHKKETTPLEPFPTSTFASNQPERQKKEFRPVPIPGQKKLRDTYDAGIEEDLVFLKKKYDAR